MPQPPFFPGFVFLGRLFRLFLRDDVLALTWVSVAASSASVFLLYAVAREILSSAALALRAALLFAFFPAVWYYSGSPLSDMAGLAAALLAMTLALRARREPSRLSFAAAALAAAAAVRPQSAVIAVVPLALAFGAADGARRIRALAFGAVVLLAGAVAPVIGAARGWAPVVAMLRRQWDTVTVPMRAGTRPALSVLARRWLIDVWDSPAYAAAITLLAVSGAVILARIGRRRALLLLLASFLPYLAAAWLFLSPTVAGRYALPYLPLFAILAAAALRALEARVPRVAAVVPLAALVAWPAVLVGPAVLCLHRNLSPPKAAADAIRRETGGNPFALLYGPDIYVPAELLFVGVPKARWDGSAAGARAALGALPIWRFGVYGWDGGGGVAFWPPHRPFFTVGHGRYVAVPYGRLEANAPSFGRGWHGEEVEVRPDRAPAPFRWMGREGAVFFPPSAESAVLEVELRVPAELLAGRPRVTFSWNGEELESLAAAESPIARSWELPAARLRKEEPNELVVRTSATVVPAATGAGSDPRALGLQLRRIRLAERTSSDRRNRN